jgi:MFS family permease
MADMAHEKSVAAQTDSIDHVSDSTPDAVEDSNEIAIHELETVGEEVGFSVRTIMAVLSMMMSYNAYIFTLLIPSATLSFINADLGPDPRYTWITISWNLGGSIFITLGGRMSDIFGRRWFFISGAAILVIGSILGATAQSIDQMIATGVLYGVGSGFLETAFGAVQVHAFPFWASSSA